LTSPGRRTLPPKPAEPQPEKDESGMCGNRAILPLMTDKYCLVDKM
jgi:hypothetical protein